MIERTQDRKPAIPVIAGEEGNPVNIRYQTDEQGNRVAVVIPLDEWEAIQERLSGHDTCPTPIEDFGMTPAEGKETRSRLEAFAPDWNSSDMDAYDHYDDARKALETR